MGLYRAIASQCSRRRVANDVILQIMVCSNGKDQDLKDVFAVEAPIFCASLHDALNGGRSNYRWCAAG